MESEYALIHLKPPAIAEVKRRVEGDFKIIEENVYAVREGWLGGRVSKRVILEYTVRGVVKRVTIPAYYNALFKAWGIEYTTVYWWREKGRRVEKAERSVVYVSVERLRELEEAVKRLSPREAWRHALRLLEEADPREPQVSPVEDRMEGHFV